MGSSAVISKNNLNYEINDYSFQVFVFGRYREPQHRKPLTTLQQVIYDSLLRGKNRREIAGHLGISTGNVDTHLSTMRTKGWDC